MTLPRKVIGLLGVIHVLLVTYSILMVTVFLAATSPASRGGFDEAMQSYGFLLFFLPLAWTLLTAYFVSKSAPPRSAGAIAVGVWSVITAMLLTIDIVLTLRTVEKDVKEDAAMNLQNSTDQ